MEEIRLRLLKSELEAQWAAIESVFVEVNARLARLQSGDPALLESLAYQLHNLYSAIEDLFKIVAGAFENNVADVSRWHTELLNRMRLEIEGVRPALVSDELYPLLDELRSFRHFFRHAYTRRLEEERVRAVVQQAARARSLLHRDLDRFMTRLAAGSTL